MHIEFPDDMRPVLEREAAAAGVPSIDLYVRIMYERAKHYVGVNGETFWMDESDGDPVGPPWTDPAVRERLLALAEEGLRSPPIDDPRGFLDRLANRYTPAAGQ